MNVNIDNALCDSLIIMGVYLCVEYHQFSPSFK